jgi:hypothetical protein
MRGDVPLRGGAIEQIDRRPKMIERLFEHRLVCWGGGHGGFPELLLLNFRLRIGWPCSGFDQGATPSAIRSVLVWDMPCSQSARICSARHRIGLAPFHARCRSG